jgi:hypothetical protein
MKPLTASTLTILVLLFTKPLAAQDYVDVARIHYAGSSINSFADNGKGSRLAEVGLDLTMPIVLTDRISILTGTILEGIKTQLYPDAERETVASITLKTGINWIHSEKWSGTYVFLPKIASDFKQLTRKDFQFGGIALLKYNHTANLKYKFGVYGNTELFGPWVVPILGLYYLSPSKKFEANVMLPLSADLNYRFTPKMHVGANFFGLVRTYHLSEGVRGSTTTDAGYVARSTNEIYAYLRLNLGKTSIIQLKVGTSLGRSYRVYYETDKVALGIPLVYFKDNREQLNVDFEDGMIGQVVYILRFSTATK